MSRLRHLVIGLALLAAACGGAGGGSAVISPEGAEVNGLLLSYQLDPGQRIAYEMDMSMDMAMDMRADGMSSTANMALDLSGLAKYAVGPGTRDGTVAVTMQASIEDLDFREFTMDGQSMLGVLGDEDLLAQMGGADLVPEITVLLDRQGNVLGINGGETFGADFLSGFGGGIGPGQDPLGIEGFFGPAFPEEKLAVGSQWTDVEHLAVPPLGELTVEATYVVTARQELQGHDVFVIKSDVTTSEVSLDLADLMKELADTSAAELEAFGLSQADFGAGMEDLFGSLSGSIDIAPMRVTGTTWFDPDAGQVIRSEEAGIITMTMDMSMPGTGSMSMDMNGTIGYELNLIEPRPTA